MRSNDCLPKTADAWAHGLRLTENLSDPLECEIDTIVMLSLRWISSSKDEERRFSLLVEDYFQVPSVNIGIHDIDDSRRFRLKILRRANGEYRLAMHPLNIYKQKNENRNEGVNRSKTTSTRVKKSRKKGY